VNDYSDLFKLYANSNKVYGDPLESFRLPTKEEIRTLGPLWPNVPPEKNGVYYFVKADRDLVEHCKTSLPEPPGSASDAESYAGDAAGFMRYIKENASVIATFKEGMNQRAFQFPWLMTKGQPSSPSPAMPLLADIRNLARFLSDAGFAAELEGRPDVAAERYIECMQMGKKLQDDSMLITQLVAMAVQAIGANGLDSLVASSSLDEVELKRIIALSRDMETTAKMRLAAVTREAEYARVTTAMSPETGAVFGKDYDAFSAFLVKTLSTPLPELLRCAEAATKEVKDKYPLQAALATSWFERMPREWARHDLIKRVLQVRAALALYRKQHGAPPDRLDALVPEFLPEVPSDPFDGEPLRYARTERGWKLWSVGYDLKDNGGEASIVDEKGWVGPDFVFTDKVRSSIDRRSHRGATKSPPAPAGDPPASSAPPADPPGLTILTYVGDTAEGKRSLGASGHAILFQRPEKARFVEAAEIFAGRYGTPEPPKEDFHLYLLNEKLQQMADLRYPYGMIERSDLRWYTLQTPSIEAPERFYVALSFNPHQTKGIYLGFDEKVKESHSFTGLPDSGFEKVKESYDWMVRVHLAQEPSGAKDIQRLADWKPVEVADPFKGCIEAKYDTGKSDGMQSYGGRGPAVRIRLSDFIPEGVPASAIKLKGLRLYASRYGSGYDPEKTSLRVLLLDSKSNVVQEETFPYAPFSYREKWVELAFSRPVPMGTLASGESLIVALDPEATQYKGIYFHYNNDPKSSHSMAGSRSNGFTDVTDREWMIRAYFTNDGAAQPTGSTSPTPAEKPKGAE
jgi:hypothetical protein